MTELKTVLEAIWSDLPQGPIVIVLSFDKRLHALKQLVDISNMICKLVLVEITFCFNFRLKQLLFQLISQAYLSCGLNWFA